jgi:hypothetical protein
MVINILLIVLATLTPSQGKGWRGIAPLHSTRADVERLLGPPSTDSSDTTFYEFQKEAVSFHYAKGPCGVESSGWNVPRGTVISIRVRPRPNLLRLSDLKLDESKYKKETNGHVRNIVSFINVEEGISYDVDTSADGMVTAVEYSPTAKDAYLRCPDAEQYLERTTKLDTYSDMNFEREKEHLDSFAEQMQRYASTQAYIMVYAGRRARVGEAEARAKRAKEYLIKGRSIEAGRIFTIDGGHQEELTVELYLVPLGARPPLPAPTVEPSEVQIIKAADVRSNNRRSTLARYNR